MLPKLPTNLLLDRSIDALVFLAKLPFGTIRGGPEIAEASGFPFASDGNPLTRLRKYGILTTHMHAGYALARQASEIMISDVAKAVGITYEFEEYKGVRLSDLCT